MVKTNNNNVKKSQKSRQTVGRTLLQSLGGVAGGYLGGPIGSALGAKAGDLLASITGMGKYTVKRNDLVNSIPGSGTPVFKNTSEGVEICHREMITDVIGSLKFGQIPFAINPGMITTFPWLSTIAKNFEEYDFLGLIFEYRPTSGSAVFNSTPNSALGTVVLATDYNVLNPAFTSKQQMESYEFSSSCVPFESMIHPVECEPRSSSLDTLYIRTLGGSIVGQDLRMSDLGNVTIGVVGMQAVYAIGELWTSYHVRLKKPRLNPLGSGSFSHIREFPAGSATSVYPLGTSGGFIDPASNLPGIQLQGTTGAFSIQNIGNYFINTAIQGATGAPTVSYGVGSSVTYSALQLWADDASDFRISDATTHAALASDIYTVNDTAPFLGAGAANTVQLEVPAGVSGATTDILIFPLPFNLH
jgi:hypothetical protein